jgi:hypothetical protein
LLRVRRQRPRGARTAEQHDELATAAHSITSSARASRLSGTSSPQPLRAEAEFKVGKTGDVAAWPRQAVDDAGGDRVEPLQAWDWISLPPRVRLAIFKHSAQAKPCFWFASVAVFFFASWPKGWENWECDEFPRARTSFERALHLKTTCFASVSDILKAVDEENRHDLRY